MEVEKRTHTHTHTCVGVGIGVKVCMFNCVRAHMRGRFEINPYQRATFVFS